MASRAPSTFVDLHPVRDREDNTPTCRSKCSNRFWTSSPTARISLSRRDLFEPPPPELHNTDGERLEPRTLYFDVDSAQAEFDALAPLAIGSARDELLEDGKFDRGGVLIEAMVPWIKRADGKRAGWKRCSWEGSASRAAN